MPIYVFHCQVCGENFELRASIKEKEIGLKQACPHCTSQEVLQMITSGVVLHGGKGLISSPCGPKAGTGCCG